MINIEIDEHETMEDMELHEIVEVTQAAINYNNEIQKGFIDIYALGDDCYKIITLELDENRVGYAFIEEFITYPLLVALYVQEDYRKQGLGTILYKYVRETFKDLHFDQPNKEMSNIAKKVEESLNK